MSDKTVALDGNGGGIALSTAIPNIGTKTFYRKLAKRTNPGIKPRDWGYLWSSLRQRVSGGTNFGKARRRWGRDCSMETSATASDGKLRFLVIQCDVAAGFD